MYLCLTQQIKEERQEDLDPTHGGGTIRVTSTYEAHSAKLWSHPHDDCAPLSKVDLHDVPPDLDVYRLLLSAAAELGPSSTQPAAYAHSTGSFKAGGGAGVTSSQGGQEGEAGPALSHFSQTGAGGASGAVGASSGTWPAATATGGATNAGSSTGFGAAVGQENQPPLYVPYAPMPLDSEASLRAWWTGMPRGRNNVLRPLALRRLVAKTAVPAAVQEVRVAQQDGAEGEGAREEVEVHAVPPQLRHKLKLEGVLVGVAI